MALSLITRKHKPNPPARVSGHISLSLSRKWTSSMVLCSTRSTLKNSTRSPPEEDSESPTQLMNSSSSSPISQSSISMAANNSAPSTDGKKVRKPYTITKSRESWTDEEHDKFLEALQLFDRDWKKIEDFVGSKTVIQIRSHAQKYFLKVQKNGTIAHVPPPRPKRKAAHPYPQKAPKNGGSMASQNEYTLGVEADTGSKGVARFSNSSIDGSGGSGRPLPNSELEKQGKQSSLLHGIPDFAEVYSFIGSVFDPDTNGHLQKLKEMDPINFETVLLLMRNLTINLSSPDFEPFKKVLSSYDVDSKTVGIAAGNIAVSER